VARVGLGRLRLGEVWRGAARQVRDRVGSGSVRHGTAWLAKARYGMGRMGFGLAGSGVGSAWCVLARRDLAGQGTVNKGGKAYVS
jgi:hypothetical protein